MVITITERQTCRVCDGKLESIWDLGEREVVNFGDKEPVKAPLHLTKCAQCHLVQLKHTLNQDYLFRKYYYQSGTNQKMRNHLKGIVEEVQKRVELRVGDTVVDIGANDGTLLGFYGTGIKSVGFEPAEMAEEKFPIINEFFSADRYFLTTTERAKIITAIAMFYDLDDPNAFLQDIKTVLAPDGLFVIEMNYLPTMLQNNAIDNICHEHLCYYSLTTLAPLLSKNGFVIDDYSFSAINGGVFRVYCRQIKPEETWTFMFPESETNSHLEWMEPYLAFKTRVTKNAYELSTFIPIEKFKGKTVAIYGASTRGLILLQLANLNRDSILYAVDRNPAKWGMLYNGIPVISEEQMRRTPPDYLLILPYGFLEDFKVREAEFLANGGKFIVPAPEPYILSSEGVEKL